jgi:cell wall-associated NlpC family hydrolase
VKAWTDDYLGIPFKANGRDRSGLDCWGLVWLIYKERHGVELPRFDQYAGVDDVGGIDALAPECLSLWTPATEMVEGVVGYFKLPAGRTHVGLYLPEDLLLHADVGPESCIVPVSRYARWLVGWYALRR